MRQDILANILLSIIAAALVTFAVRPALDPGQVEAHSNVERQLFIEPGVQMLRTPDGSRNVYGRVVVDLRTGNVWGFPTPTGDPYPFNSVSAKPETSQPFPLGRFALEVMDK